MPRPSDWHLVGLGGDPTPGDAFGIRSLAGKYRLIAETAADARDIVRRARSSHGASSWVGEAGDVFRSESEGLPGELDAAAVSYAAAEAALRTWADRLEDAQSQADRGLQQAREAQGELEAARAAIGSASWSLTAAQARVLQYEGLELAQNTVGLPPGVAAPTDYQVRSAGRAVTQAQQSLRAAEAAEAAAQARLDAARALVLEAKARRDEAETATVQAIGEAAEHAVKPSSIWEAITSSQAWQVVVTIATVVVTVVGIVAIFVGGPLVWALLAAATVLLIANALMQIAQGKDAWFELATLAIGLIPGGAALAAGGRIVSGIARLGALGNRIATGIRSVATSVSTGFGAAQRVVVDLAQGVVQRIMTSRPAWWVRTQVHVLRGGQLTPQGNIIVRHWTSIEEGPLGAPNTFPADTFRSSTYDEVIVSNPNTELFRTTTATGNPAGGFWAHEPPSGPLSSQLGFALKPEWNMTNPGTVGGPHVALPQATHVVSMRPPLGTSIFEGPAGPQVSTGQGLLSGGSVSNVFPGRLEGGTQQVYIPPAVMNDLASLVSGKSPVGP